MRWEETHHGNDIRRGSSGTGSTFVSRKNAHKSGVVVGDDNTDSQRTANEEDGKSSVHSLERSLNKDAWSLSLTSNHGQVLRSDDGEGRTPETAEESLKSTEGASRSVLSERSRVLPVTEPVGVVLGVSTNHRHECEGEQEEDENDLSAGQPEFGFTVCADSKDVDQEVQCLDTCQPMSSCLVGLDCQLTIQTIGTLHGGMSSLQ